MPLRFFVLALIAFLIVPRMAQRGMFGDGLLYATIARNLSIGVGSFWAPSYTGTAWTQFFEHPPLGFVLEGGLFWLLGDHLIVERLFSLLVFAIHAWIVVAIWRRVQPAAFDWLPLLFWILPSIVTWAVVNNMLENTQALFTSAAILLLLGARTASTTSAIVTRSAAGGLAIVAAVLTKGPVGFFPLAAPFFFRWLPDAQPRPRLRLITIAMIAVVVSCGVGLTAYEPSRHALTTYVQTQVAPSLEGQREINHDRLPVFRHLGVGIVGRMGVLAALFWIAGRRRTAGERTQWGPAVCFLGLGLCASAPIAVSPKLAGHYFVPSVPLFALGFASLALGPAAALMQSPGRWARRVPIALGVVLLIAAVLVPLLVGPIGRRDRGMLRDLDAIDRAMPRNMTIGACRHPRSSRDWGLHSYVQRLYRVTLDAREVPVNGWLLQADHACSPPPSCVPAARGDTLVLLRCDRHQAAGS